MINQDGHLSKNSAKITTGSGPVRPITANVAHVDLNRVQPFADVNQSQDMSSAQV